MRKLFLVLLMTLAMSLTANLLLYSETDTSPSTEPMSKIPTKEVIDADWLLEDGFPGVNIYPYDAGGYDLLFPWAVIIMSESDGAWVFSELKNIDLEREHWKAALNAETSLHNETINERNIQLQQRLFWQKVSRYGIPAGIVTGFILGIVVSR